MNWHTLVYQKLLYNMIDIFSTLLIYTPISFMFRHDDEQNIKLLRTICRNTVCCFAWRLLFFRNTMRCLGGCDLGPRSALSRGCHILLWGGPPTSWNFHRRYTSQFITKEYLKKAIYCLRLYQIRFDYRLH